MADTAIMPSTAVYDDLVYLTDSAGNIIVDANGNPIILTAPPQGE